jgi:tRNA/tmRNA/rRNA uracil-C5-methylase (TrmA/RlmC/RlmD family)
LSKEVQDFIRKHENEDPGAFVLKQKSIAGIPISFIADQISGRKKAKDKIPAYTLTPGVIFPPSVNLEQSSSEITGKFKERIIIQEALPEYKSCADLTGGFGVDSYFFSKVFKQVDYIELDPELAEIAKHNHHILGVSNIDHHNTTAENFLSTNEKGFDLIFIDPSRRQKGDQRVYSFTH